MARFAVFCPFRASGRKGLSEIVSVLLVALITTALVGTVYLWGAPLVTKNQHTTKVDRIYNSFNEAYSNSLVHKLRYVALNGGRETFVSDSEGMWELRTWDDLAAGPDNNSLEFNTFSKVTNVVIEGPGPDGIPGNEDDIDWAPLTIGGSCPPEDGIVGHDSPFVVCAKAQNVEGRFNVVYRAWGRVLDDPSGTKGYKIHLVKDPNGPLSSTGKSVTMRRANVYTCTPPGASNECPDKKLIITEIEILLV